MLTLVGAGQDEPRPRPVGVATVPEVADDTPRPWLLRHVRRVADLHAELRQGGVHGGRLSPLAPFGLALSMALDLRMAPTGESVRWAWRRAYVGDNTRRLQDAVYCDLPTYSPSSHPQAVRGWKCRVVGPRGGVCGRTLTHAVAVTVDMTSGEWVLRRGCPRHPLNVRRRQPTDPVPPANTGGMLGRVFSEWDWTYLYGAFAEYLGVSWDPKHYRPSEERKRPALRVVTSDLEGD